MIKNIIKLFRIEQYIKNFFIFAPLFFSFQFTFTNFISALLAFLLFSLMASSVYILNDIFDVKEDMLHPNKRIRPIASNLITTSTAYFLSILLAVIALMGSYILNINIFYVLIIYLSINILYSAKLKYIPIIDIIIIAFGFVLRLFVGGYAINEMITNWIIALTFILSIFIALAKRREDIQLLLDGKETRRNVRFYNIEILNLSLIHI